MFRFFNSFLLICTLLGNCLDLLAQQENTTEQVQYDQQRTAALMHFDSGNYQAALPMLQSAFEQSPLDDQVRLALIDSLLVLKHPSDARQLLDNFLDLNSDAYQLRRARTAMALNDYQAAGELYEQLIRQANAEFSQQAAVEYLPYLASIDQHQSIPALAQIAFDKDTSSFSSALLSRLAQQRVDAENQEERRRSLKLGLGYRIEYDDNLALLPDDDFLFGNVEEDDFRHVFTVDLLFQQPLPYQFSLYTELHATQSLHHQATDFDFTSINGVVGTGQNLNKWGWRLPVSITHNRFGGDEFNSDIEVTPGIFYKLKDDLFLQWYAGIADRDFQQFSFPEDNRSGEELYSGFLLAGYLLEKLKIRSFFEYSNYDADERNWERRELQAYLFAEYEILPRFSLGGGIEYRDYNFSNVNVPLLIERNDHSWEYFATASYDLGNQFVLRGQFSYTDNESNINLFEYDRYVVSLGISKWF